MSNALASGKLTGGFIKSLEPTGPAQIFGGQLVIRNEIITVSVVFGVDSV